MKRQPRGDVGRWRGKRIRPGERATVQLTVSRSYGGAAVRLPVHVWRGPKPGPTVFITGAVHGDELNGTGTIRHIIMDSPFELVAGTLVLVPVVNVLAFERLSRYSPDRRDLNRTFPGLRNGSLTSRLAYAVTKNVINRCDYGIDLHTAAIHRTNFPNLRADMDQEATARLATLFGAEMVISNQGQQGSLRREAARSGCATLTLEAGETLKVEPAVVEYAMRGIRNVLAGLHMIEGEVVQPAYRMVVEETRWVRARTGGFLQFHVHPGDTVEKGQTVAINTGLVGQQRKVLVAPHDGVVLGMTTMPAVSPGDPVCHLAFPSAKAFRKLERAIDKLPDDSLLARMYDDLATSVLKSELDDEDGPDYSEPES